MRRTGCDSHVNGSNDESLTSAGVTSSTRFRKVRRIHRGASVGRPEDIVYAMVRSTVGHTLGSATHGKAVITVGERRNPVGRQVIAQGETLIAVASAQVVMETRAAFTRDAGSFGARIKCSPWQSLHTGAPETPFFMACPCTLSRYVFAMTLWHCPQVVGILKWLTLERASCEGKIPWLP